MSRKHRAESHPRQNTKCTHLLSTLAVAARRAPLLARATGAAFSIRRRTLQLHSPPPPTQTVRAAVPPTRKVPPDSSQGASRSAAPHRWLLAHQRRVTGPDARPFRARWALEDEEKSLLRAAGIRRRRHSEPQAQPPAWGSPRDRERVEGQAQARSVGVECTRFLASVEAPHDAGQREVCAAFHESSRIAQLKFEGVAAKRVISGTPMRVSVDVRNNCPVLNMGFYRQWKSGTADDWSSILIAAPLVTAFLAFRAPPARAYGAQPATTRTAAPVAFREPLRPAAELRCIHGRWTTARLPADVSGP